ncbi:hypothetical protein, partial [Marinitoga sp. 1197]|uniref:hypothetical protein n=1 Tax=Marinitoga sp. 1197 TaxID=1428449 RepID=UPI0006411134
IIDISDPYNPEQIGHYDTARWANGVYVKDNLAFVADSSNGLVIIDISDPANPVLEYDMLWFFAYGVSGY